MEYSAKIQNCQWGTSEDKYGTYLYQHEWEIISFSRSCRIYDMFWNDKIFSIISLQRLRVIIRDKRRRRRQNVDVSPMMKEMQKDQKWSWDKTRGRYGCHLVFFILNTKGKMLPLSLSAGFLAYVCVTSQCHDQSRVRIQAQRQLHFNSLKQDVSQK